MLNFFHFPAFNRGFPRSRPAHNSRLWAIAEPTATTCGSLGGIERSIIGWRRTATVVHRPVHIALASTIREELSKCGACLHELTIWSIGPPAPSPKVAVWIVALCNVGHCPVVAFRGSFHAAVCLLLSSSASITSRASTVGRFPGTIMDTSSMCARHHVLTTASFATG